MPKHLSIGGNHVSGTVHLENIRKAKVFFRDDAGNTVTFSKRPNVTLTLLNASSSVPFKKKDTKTGGVYDGFIIGFQSVVTVDVDWQASEK